MKSWFGKFVPVIFLCDFLFTTFSLFTIFTNVSTLQASEKMIDHTRSVENSLSTTYALLVTAESQQRAYLISGDPVLLNQYNASLKLLSSQIQHLADLTGDNKKHQQNIAKLRMIIPQAIAVLQQEIVDHEQSGRIDISAFSIQQEPPLLDEINKILLSMRNDEEQLLQLREDNTMNEYGAIYTNAGLTFFGNMIIIAIAFYFLRKELQERTDIEQSKDDFINLASHELNTPITSLKIFSRVLRNKLSSKNRTNTKKYLDKIDEQTNKLTMLITDLLDISRIQTGKIRITKEPFSLFALVKETVEGIQGTTRIHTIITRQNYEKDIFADRYRIYQVLVNLLTNAIKYSPKGGTIVISTAKKQKEVVISVTDFGIGIDKKYQRKIFEKLYQVTDTKEKTFPGLGIGLFISREIIARHGGRLWVESKKGKGSTFFFTVPIKNYGQKNRYY